jgi:AcrR family transcriptional regulator
MTIPARPSAPPADEAWLEPDPGRDWADLSPDAKRERLLCAAGRVFARGGLDAPMPLVAAEAGAGVASLYRQFPSKHELLAALVLRRLEEFEQAAADAAARTGDHWAALTETLWMFVERRTGDDFLGQARAQVRDHPNVAAATARAARALEQLLAKARAEGTLRADATTLDIRLLFAATHAAKQVEPAAWRRTLELFIEALAARPARPARAG